MGAGGAPDALALREVAVSLGRREVLRGVALDLPRGEVLGLAGPNGAGKTTLLRVASRVLRPDAGRVLVEGDDVAALSRRELARRMAVVPQDAPPSFPFTVAEIVLMGRTPHLGLLGFETSADLSRAREAMERVGVAHLAARSILQLSGGERQMVLLARALAQDPRVLLLDEPTAHLDLRHRVTVLDLVREFVAAGRSALVVSHDLTLAGRCCDRIALLAAGRIVDCGPPPQVLTPANLRAAFGIEAEVLASSTGAPVVVPRATLPRPPG